MKTLYPAIIYCLAGMTVWLVAGNVSIARGEKAEVGRPAPPFVLTSVKGDTFALTDYRGSYVVLEWTNYDCPFVRKFYGSGTMQKLQEELAEKGVIWLSICSSAPGKQGHFTKEEWMRRIAEWDVKSKAVLLDPNGEIGRAYGAMTTPHMFVINPEGVLIYAGAIDDKPSTDPNDIPSARNYVKAALEAAWDGKPVETPTTKPYGCSVKY